MLTNIGLLIEKPHPGGGIQRIYKFNNGYGLSLVNSPTLHRHPFAWEAAVLAEMNEDGSNYLITYDTPLTENVEVFEADEETNAFIKRAALYFGL